MIGPRKRSTVQVDCRVCGRTETIFGLRYGKYRCQACKLSSFYGDLPVSDATGAARAQAAVGHAVKAGLLPPAASCTCVDCGGSAKHYDHRDYAQPLAVEPVCQSCNYKRGPAKPDVYVMLAVLSRHPDSYVSPRFWPMLTPGELAGLELCGVLDCQVIPPAKWVGCTVCVGYCPKTKRRCSSCIAKLDIKEGRDAVEWEVHR